MFEELFSVIGDAARENVTSSVSSLISVILPLFGAAFGLYVVYVAYKIVLQQDFIVKEVISVMAAFAAVITIGLSTEPYIANVVPIVLNSGDDLAGSLTGGDASSAATLDSMIKDLTDTILLIADKIKLGWSPSAVFNLIMFGCQIILIALGGLCFIAVALAYLLLAKVALGLLACIGPIFIAFAFFPSTRSFFQAWTGQVFNYTLLNYAFPLLFNIFKLILLEVAYEGNITYMTSFYAFIAYCVMIFISVQVPTMCSTLSGGIGISGVVGNVAGVGGAIRNMFRGKPKPTPSEPSKQPSTKNQIKPG
jgi:type IV secretion system protein VirB6